MEFNHVIKAINTLFKCSFIKTVYINFKVLPFKQAIKLPILVYKRVELIGVYKGCLQIINGERLHTFMLHLGQDRFPVYSNKGLYTQLRFQKGGKLLFGNSVHIKNGCSVNVYKNGTLVLGSNFLMNQYGLIFCKSSINIGNNTRIGWFSQIYDTDFHYLYNKETNGINPIIKPVIIENNVWIANHVTISKGGYIPPFSIIASNSVVNKKLITEEKGSIFAGIPAELKKTGYFRVFEREIELELDDFFAHSSNTFTINNIEQIKNSIPENE